MGWVERRDTHPTNLYGLMNLHETKINCIYDPPQRTTSLTLNIGLQNFQDGIRFLNGKPIH